MAGTEGTAAREWPLWSTTARVVVTDHRLLDAACELVAADLTAIERASSRFDPHSELQRVAPLLPDGAWVSDLLAELVRGALDAARATDGDVDPTLARAMDAVGYDRDIRLLHDDGFVVTTTLIETAGWKRVTLDGNHLQVPAHLALDLGATSKAIAADRSARLVADRLGCGALVSLGGDIATAGPDPDGGWQVRVQDQADDPLQLVRLAAGWGMATSSTQKRRWTRGTQWQHHILDPRTALPARPVWRSVTVAAPSCLEANTLTTAAVVRGSRAIGWLDDLGVAARLVDTRARVITLGGWPPAGDTWESGEVAS